MSNFSDDYTNEKLAKLEGKISRSYQRAWRQVNKKLEEQMLELAEEYEIKKQLVKDGKMTKAEFNAWYKQELTTNEELEELKVDLCDKICDMNERACELINATTPDVYVVNHNYSAWEFEMYANVSFDTVDENTVDRLIKEKNHISFRVNRVNRKADYEWNAKRINTHLLSGILLGEHPTKIANRFFRVMGSNHTAAIRNARTSVTSAQNGGRYDSYVKAGEMGMELQKEWIATMDSRTRSSHGALDGERVPYDEAFSNGLMYPADPDGAPEEVYNCRCSMRAIFEKINDYPRMTYQDWANGVI